MDLLLLGTGFLAVLQFAAASPYQLLGCSNYPLGPQFFLTGLHTGAGSEACASTCQSKSRASWATVHGDCFCGVGGDLRSAGIDSCASTAGTIRIYSTSEGTGHVFGTADAAESRTFEAADLHAAQCVSKSFPWKSAWDIAYGSDKLRVRGDTLRISLDSNAGGARLRTLTTVQYGLLQFEAKFDITPGSISAFYLSSALSNSDRSQQEIDWEVISGSPGVPGTLWANIFYDGNQPSPANIKPGLLRERTGDPHLTLANWNRCEIKWEPEEVRWYVNNQLVQTTPNDVVTTPWKEMYVFISFWGNVPDSDFSWAGKLRVKPGTIMHSYYRNVRWERCSTAPRVLPGARIPCTLAAYKQCGGTSKCPKGRKCGDFAWSKFRCFCARGSKCVRRTKKYYHCLPGVSTLAIRPSSLAEEGLPSREEPITVQRDSWAKQGQPRPIWDQSDVQKFDAAQPGEAQPLDAVTPAPDEAWQLRWNDSALTGSAQVHGEQAETPWPASLGAVSALDTNTDGLGQALAAEPAAGQSFAQGARSFDGGDVFEYRGGARASQTDMLHMDTELRDMRTGLVEDEQVVEDVGVWRSSNRAKFSFDQP